MKFGVSAAASLRVCSYTWAHPRGQKRLHCSVLTVESIRVVCITKRGSNGGFNFRIISIKCYDVSIQSWFMLLFSETRWIQSHRRRWSKISLSTKHLYGCIYCTIPQNIQLCRLTKLFSFTVLYSIIF